VLLKENNKSKEKKNVSNAKAASPAIAKPYTKTCVDGFEYKKGGKDRKKFLIDGHLPPYFA
jgi:hypothetical protein